MISTNFMLGWLINKRRLLAEPKLFGRWGEKRCEKYLKKKGLKTLVRNFSSRAGEIDLIMADADGTIVFVEVKTRADEDFTNVETVITYAKKVKMTKAARYFLKIHNIENRPCRFDVVAIILPKDGKEQIRHYKDAFVP